MKIKSTYLFLLLASMLAACGAPVPTAAPIVVPASTTVPAPTPAPLEAATIAQGFWDAIHAKNIDAAMAFVVDDVQTSGGPVNFTTKAGFSAFMLRDVERGFTLEISDLKAVSEDTVTYTMKVYDNNKYLQASGSDLKLQVKDGKIALIEFAN